MADDQTTIPARVEIQIKIIDAVVGLLHRTIPWAAAIWIVYLVGDAAKTFAGQDTSAHLWLQVIADLKADRAMAYIVGVIGGAYGLKQRRLRRANIKRLASRVRELEAKIDAGRSTSRLNPDGTTREEDMP